LEPKSKHFAMTFRYDKEPLDECGREEYRPAFLKSPLNADTVYEPMLKPQRILVVDDDPMILRFLTEILEESHQLMAVSSGEEALSCISQFSPDIVLLDVMMPGLDGFETCRRIREDDQASRIRVLFLTARSDLSERLRGYAAGGDDYITKPFAMEELRAKIAVFSRLTYDERRSPPMTPTRLADEKYLEIVYLIQHKLADLIFIRAESPYCHLVLDAAKPKMDRIRIPIQVLDDYFGGKKLVRTHRSFLVNPQKIIALNHKKNNELRVVLNRGKPPDVMVPVGRSHLERLIQQVPSLFNL